MAPPIEISIPTTSTANASNSNPKPFTLYNITLRLPLRSFVVQKRYSDFVTLHQTLSNLVPSPPPAPLPPKTWWPFRSTVSSPAAIDTRRQGLEQYLRAIAESPDRRWRDTSAWRTFLHLPSNNSTASVSGASTRSGGNVSTIGLAGANNAAATDPATWMDLHRETKTHLHEARLQLARRDAAGGGDTSSAVAEAGAAAKKALVRAGSLIQALQEGLRTMTETKRLREGEARRRRDLVTALKTERDGLDKLSNSLASSRASTLAGPANGSDKAALLAGASSSSGPRSGGRVLGAPLQETARTRELDNQQVLLLQQQQMAEQDQDVEALAKIIKRQKEMGLAIKDEVDIQTEMLGRLDEDVDRTAAKVKVAKDRVRRLGK